jgi:hypothetical protein
MGSELSKENRPSGGEACQDHLIQIARARAEIGITKLLVSESGGECAYLS